MKISIITPSYNQGNYIKKCIDSVIKEADNCCIQHIILDNCSTDRTKEYLDWYAENKRNVELNIIIEKDKGQTAAINKGFELADGDLIMWLNTDEWFEEGSLIEVMQLFKKKSDVDCFFGGCNFKNANGDLVKAKNENFYNRSMLLYYGCFIPSCAAFFRRSVLIKYGYLDVKYKVTMDYEWYVRMAYSGCKFESIKKIVSNFTWHDNNISSNYVEKRLAERIGVQRKYSGVNFLGDKYYFGLIKLFWKIVRSIKNRG